MFSDPFLPEHIHLHSSLPVLLMKLPENGMSILIASSLWLSQTQRFSRYIMYDSEATSTLRNCCAVTTPCMPSLVKKTPPTSEFHLYIYIYIYQCCGPPGGGPAGGGDPAVRQTQHQYVATASLHCFSSLKKARSMYKLGQYRQWMTTSASKKVNPA